MVRYFFIMLAISFLTFERKANSSSLLPSKWSSIARLLRPVINTNVSIPAAIASSTAYYISGLSIIGKSSLGMALVAGKNRVPNPATGKTAFLILVCILIIFNSTLYHSVKLLIKLITHIFHFSKH